MASPTFTTSSFNFYLQGLTVRAGNLGDTHEIIENFTVESKTNTLMNMSAAVYEAIASEHRMLGAFYTNSCGGTASDMWCSGARLNDISMQAGPLNTGTISFHYTTLYLAVNPANEAILPSSIEFTGDRRQTELFRLDSDPAPGFMDESVSDIVGNPVSAGLKGQIVDVSQIKIRIRVVKDASAVGYDMETVLGLTDDILNKRNLNVFLGFHEHTVECVGVAAQKLDNEFYELVYDLVYDEYWWFDQIPKVYPEDGQPAIIEVSPGVFDYEEVKWKRQTKTSVDFDAIIWPIAAQGDYAKKGWWP